MEDIHMIRYAPAMTYLEFAAIVGVSEGIVQGWAKRDYIPTVKFGRHRLVNVAKLNQELLASTSQLRHDSSIQQFLEHKSNFDKLPSDKRKKMLREFDGDIEKAVFAYASGSAGG